MYKQAMYIHRDGSIRIKAPYAESNGPSRIVHYEVLTRRNPDRPYEPPSEHTPVQTERLIFRLIYESNHYYIYEEM